MKRLHYIVVSVVLLIISCIFFYRHRPVPKFARWEIDSLKEISPMMPVATDGKENTAIVRKWYITPRWGNTLIDKNQILSFNADGTFCLHLTKDVCTELMEELSVLFPIDFLSAGTHLGKYKCYDVNWCGCTCDGSYGVILFDNKGNEFGRYVYVYVGIDGDSFDLSKVYLNDVYKDDINTGEGSINLIPC